ncbi:hypothetical protein GCM10023189_47310 [Nibrella saemangeumensis]|uniref:Uncharacterized protein n=1 Tax=Nibrella saemangeumensis TaxID=1084526 RepID=A0ABP8NHJ4_9BACT
MGEEDELVGCIEFTTLSVKITPIKRTDKKAIIGQFPSFIRDIAR